MHISDQGPLSPLEFVSMVDRLTDHIRPSSGIDAAERRSEVGRVLSMIWGRYRPPGVWDAPVDLVDQLYQCAINLIHLASELERAIPIHDITIGNMSEEAERSLALLRRFGDWDIVTVRTTTINGENYEGCQPLDAVQGMLVRRARDLGMSWRRIGEAVGMSAQGIQQKAQDRGWMFGSSAAGDD